jgi:RNA polymerase sigma-70 factor (ECF subfamily)
MDEHSDYLKRTAYVMLGDRQIAEDLVQETFISFFRASHQFRKTASYKTYLYRILVNHVRMHYRKNKEKYSETLDQQQHGEVVFEDRIILAMDIQRCLSQLKPKYREIIVLRYFNEMKIDEISAISNLTKSAVKMRLKRGREKFFAILEEGGQDNEMERITG